MLPVILGIAGDTLSKEERDLFRAFPPFGFILFRRNIWNPEQVKNLIAELRDVTGRQDVPILIDQEGARVQKLRPPHWLDLPSMREIGDLYRKNSKDGLRALILHGEITAGQLNELGFNTVCAPVVDVPVPGAHDVIGDRAFAEDADTVIALATELSRLYLANGITPIIKHIPGHGRADLDSHYALPVVDTSLDELNATDFKAFRDVASHVGAKNIWAMTAHVQFNALDDSLASVSKKTMDYIRSQLGITGPIIADTIEMDALGGSLAERAQATIEAGCDAFLYCSGSFEGNKEVLSSAPAMTETAKQRFALAAAARHEKTSIDWRAKYDELKTVMKVTEFRGYRAKEDITEALAMQA